MSRELWVLESDELPLRTDDRDKLEEIIAAGVRLGHPPGQEKVVRYVPADNHYTRAEVFAILLNVGVDTDCGACMGQAFTGYALESHTCKAHGPPCHHACGAGGGEWFCMRSGCPGNALLMSSGEAAASVRLDGETVVVETGET